MQNNMKRAHFIFFNYRSTLVNVWKILNPYRGLSSSRRMRILIPFQTSSNPKPKPISNEMKPVKSLTYQIASCLKLRSNFIWFFSLLEEIFLLLVLGEVKSGGKYELWVI